MDSHPYYLIFDKRLPLDEGPLRFWVARAHKSSLGLLYDSLKTSGGEIMALMEDNMDVIGDEIRHTPWRTRPGITAVSMMPVGFFFPP
jgi:hypothetical protein